jgi:hypothetical protein
MNLFRSEEDAQNWSEFAPGTEPGLMPLSEAAKLLSSPRHRDRLKPDYVSTLSDSASQFIETLMAVSGNNPFWDPR